jgi:hypothetical protein
MSGRISPPGKAMLNPRVVWQPKQLLSLLSEAPAVPANVIHRRNAKIYAKIVSTNRKGDRIKIMASSRQPKLESPKTTANHTRVGLLAIA